MLRYPKIPRFGERGGEINPHFLNAPLFVEQFLRPLAVMGGKVGPIIFEFTKIHSSDFSEGTEFVSALETFLSALPAGYVYGVELRNRSWLAPAYLECLRRYKVAQVFNSWTDMPPVSEQIQSVGDFHTGEHTVARFLPRSSINLPGRSGIFQLDLPTTIPRFARADNRTRLYPGSNVMTYTALAAAQQK